MNNSKEHTLLKNQILIRIGRMPGVRVWGQYVGKVVPFHRLDSNPFQCGVPGQSDIFALVGPYGRLACIEVKTGDGSQSEAQKSWEAAVKRCGGIYVVARSVQDALDAIEKAKML